MNPPWVLHANFNSGFSGAKLIVNGPFQAPGINSKIKRITPIIAFLLSIILLSDPYLNFMLRLGNMIARDIK